MKFAIPKPLNNFNQIADFEWFKLKDTLLDKEWTGMMLAHQRGPTLMLIDHTVNGAIRATKCEDFSHQTRFEFIRYLTTDEIVSIPGSETPQKAVSDGKSLMEIESELKTSHNLDSIPDFMPYQAVFAAGTYSCINHPAEPDSVRSQKQERYMLLYYPDGSDASNHLEKRMKPGWRFNRFLEFSELPRTMQEYIKSKV